MTRRVGTHLLTALTCSGLFLSASAFHRAPALPVTVELRGGTLVAVVLRSAPACLTRQRRAGRDLTFQDGPTRLHIEAASIRTLTIPAGLHAPSTLTTCPDFTPAHWTIRPGAPSVLHRQPSPTLTDPHREAMTHHPCTTTIRRRLLTTTGPRRARLLSALDRLFEAHDRHDQNLGRRAVHQLAGASPADRLRPPRPANTPLPTPAPRPDRLRQGGAA